MTYIGVFITKFLAHLAIIAKSIWSWVCAIGLVALNYIAGHETSISLILLVSALDLFWAVWAAIKLHTFATSTLAKYTFAKMSIYGSVIIIFIALDRLTVESLDFCVPVIASLIIMVEGWSCLGNASIVFPRFVFLRLIRGILVAEIANKLQCHKEEVEKILNGLEKEQITRNHG